MAMVVRKILMPLNLGKALGQNGVTSLFEVQLSKDGGNALAFGSDNGLFMATPATPASIPALSLVPGGGIEGQILMWKSGKPTWVTPLVAISLK